MSETTRRVSGTMCCFSSSFYSPPFWLWSQRQCGSTIWQVGFQPFWLLIGFFAFLVWDLWKALEDYPEKGNKVDFYWWFAEKFVSFNHDQLWNHIFSLIILLYQVSFMNVCKFIFKLCSLMFWYIYTIKLFLYARKLTDLHLSQMNIIKSNINKFSVNNIIVLHNLIIYSIFYFSVCAQGLGHARQILHQWAISTLLATF